MSELTSEPQAPVEAGGGSPQVDLNAALDPLSDTFGENLAQFLSERDQFMLSEMQARMPAPPAAAEPAAPAEMTDAERQYIDGELDSRGVAPGDRGAVYEAAMGFLQQHGDGFQGDPRVLAAAALDMAAQTVQQQSIERGQRIAAEVSEHFAQSRGVPVDARKALERATEITDDLVLQGEPETPATAIAALYRATLEAAGVDAALTPRSVMEKHLAVQNATAAVERHLAPQPARRDANGRFAAKSPQDVFAKYFDSPGAA